MDIVSWLLQFGKLVWLAVNVYTVDTAGLKVHPVISFPETPAAGDQVKELYVPTPVVNPMADVLEPTQIESSVEARVNAGPGVTVMVTGVLVVSQPVNVSSTAT